MFILEGYLDYCVDICLLLMMILYLLQAVNRRRYSFPLIIRNALFIKLQLGDHPLKEWISIHGIHTRSFKRRSHETDFH